ncbi:MAG TPA: HU family DNA-binding protein [Abditibacteriaceae bacterium]|jgi:nucleoid DNA-binding protein
MAAANKAPLSRTDVVSEIAAETQLAPRQVDEVVKALEGSLRRALSSGGEVRMSGFGTFRVSERGARTGRNPQTGESIKIAASKNVRFSAAKAFKDAIGGGKSAGKGGAAKGGAAKGGATKGAAKGGAEKGGATKGGAAKAGAAKGGAAKGGATKGAAKGGAAKGGAAKGAAKGGRK